MPKIKKKGTSGQAKNYITRTQAVRKLQISLPDFRRLCIFKGIYPREPRNKKKASKSSTPSTTFYYTKDIQYLLHEPLLAKFREHKAVSKKIARSLGRGEVGDAARLEKSSAPKVTLDHIIKQRYPTFVDALRDLDDALSLLFLFASLPSTLNVPPKTISLCQRLCLEFEHYLITTHALRKSFLSIKGIYYQATIQGQDILWLVPYKFVQKMTGDVDFRIMATFVEFYTTLLGFVNFRLYTSVGLIYPPKFNAKSDEEGAELSALTLEGRDIDEPKAIEPPSSDQAETNGTQQLPEAVQQQLASIQEATLENAQNTDTDPQLDPTVSSDAIDAFTTTAPDADTLLQPSPADSTAPSLFAPFTFYISRECPKSPLEFLLRAFGCKRIGWDAVLGDGAYTTNEFDPSITHQVVDRPPLGSESWNPSNETAQSQDSPAENGHIDEEGSQDGVVAKQGWPHSRMANRIYIQPQWVWDCINQVKLLRPDLYAPGATLPPHLSPWVKPSKGTYDPTAPVEADAEEAATEPITNGDAGTAGALKDDSEEAESEDDDDESVHNDMTTAADHSDTASFAGFTSDHENEETLTDEQHHQRELLAEAQGAPLKSILKSSNTAEAKARQQRERERDRKAKAEAEELERRKMMMPNRKRKLVEKMLYSNKAKEGEVEKLVGKRRKIEGERRKRA